MKGSKPNDPHRLDVLGLATRGDTLGGESDARAMPRLFDAPADAGEGSATWSLAGRREARLGGEPLVLVDLAARAAVPRLCQRCLEPLVVPIAVEHTLRFVRGEAEAERLDAEGDDDVLALEPVLDAVALVEDELLLAMPIVPLHERCIDVAAVGRSDADEAPDDPQPSPFAVLAGLRGKGSAH